MPELQRKATMERLLLDREGLEMKLGDMATHEEVDSFGSEVGNH